MPGGVGLSTLECIGLRGIPKRTKHYPPIPPPSCHLLWRLWWARRREWWSEDSQQRVSYGGWVWVMCGRVAKPHKVFFPIAAAADPRKVTMITIIPILLILATQMKVSIIFWWLFLNLLTWGDPDSWSCSFFWKGSKPQHKWISVCYQITFLKNSFVSTAHCTLLCFIVA